VSFAFDGAKGPIFVAAEISGPTGRSNLRLLLDTGATTSLVDPLLLMSVGYDVQGSIDVVRIAMGYGVGSAPRLMLTRLTALSQHRFGSPVVAHSLPADVGVDGLLGLDFLRGRVLTLDFPNGLATLV
jgi:hypothetical protein